MKNKRKPLSFHIGNALIALSFFSTLYIYFPLIRVYFFPPKISIPESAFSISIPSIQAQSIIIENVNPWNESAYRQKLEKGVAHALGSKFPEDKGTVYLFAHSTGMPWEITRENTVFLKLHQLNPGDEIILTRNKTAYTYRVRELQTVSPRAIHYPTQNFTKNELILQTCTPIGTDWMRLLVFADPIL